MGWSKGEDSEGRAIGYGVQATCDAPGCESEIDRGTAHACGGYHGTGEDVCGGYFCSGHEHSHDCAADLTGKEVHPLLDEAATELQSESAEAWATFRDAGFLWLVNRALHVFGWAIVFYVNEETGEYSAVRPIRVKVRGFSRECEERGFKRITEWMRDNGAQLAKEVNDDG